MWGPASRDLLVHAGIDPRRVVVTGAPHMDLALTMATSSLREAVEIKHGLIHGKPRVLFCTSDLTVYPLPLEFWDMWTRFTSSHPDVEFLIKFRHFFDPCSLISRADLGPTRIFQQENPYELIAASDVCMFFGYSSIGAECIGFGKPTVELQWQGKMYGTNYARRGVVEVIRDSSEFRKILDLMDIRLWSTRKQIVEQFIRDEFFLLDGQATKRVIDVIRSSSYS